MALYNKGKSEREINLSLNRSRCLTQKFSKQSHQSQESKKEASYSNLGTKPRKALLREAFKGEMNSAEIKKSLNLPVKTRRVQKILKDNPSLEYKKMKTTLHICIYGKSKICTNKFARNYVAWEPQKWNRTIFSDEKKFNLDGPDRLAYY